MAQRKDRIRVHIDNKEFSVVGGAFQDMLAAVKQINGRRFLGELKVWQLPGPVEDVRRQLDISSFQLEGGAPAAPPSAAAATQSAGVDRIRIAVAGQPLTITGGVFQDMLALVKNLPNRRFDSASKLWEISADVGVVKGIVESAGFTLEGAENIMVSAPPMEPLSFAAPSGPPPFVPPNFDDTPPPFADDEPPDWWDDMPPAPFEGEIFFDEPDLAGVEPFPVDPPPARPKSAARAGGDRIRIMVGDSALAITGGSFQEMLAVVKGVPERRFDPTEKVWVLPAAQLGALQQSLKTAGFDLDAEF